ncbi:hypothetical protein T492DRAFT_832172 [Pavlovales sp. CCMP2436]|nr:hypothetical protein T492DRAFT_832172 [Pavlovales sp. CCMP2436]
MHVKQIVRYQIHKQSANALRAVREASGGSADPKVVHILKSASEKADELAAAQLRGNLNGISEDAEEEGEEGEEGGRGGGGEEWEEGDINHNNNGISEDAGGGGGGREREREVGTQYACGCFCVEGYEEGCGVEEGTLLAQLAPAHDSGDVESQPSDPGALAAER